MNQRVVRSAFALVAALACKGSLEPNLTDRWASTGVELVTAPRIGHFLLACSKAVFLPNGVPFDSQSRIRFAGTTESMAPPFTAYPFVFAGQLQGDTLVAVLTLTTPAGPVERELRLVRNGDPQWPLIDCAA